eukprot:TRINITY_DN1732_c0_g1_i4.p1 TRINITY_DN1732_c0_g1~~TRINITY_DN1732_c0_g1_i4.p1  ORF type:complete len:186 (-),score=49.62 TRINITY_DN1732_c0_g1_i4:33-590(-)
MKEVVNRIQKWAKKEQVKEIVVLSSTSAVLLPDPSLKAGVQSTIFFKCNSIFPKEAIQSKPESNSIRVVPIDQLINQFMLISNQFGFPSSTYDEIFSRFVKKGSMPRIFLEEEIEDKVNEDGGKIPLILFVLFCFEGNNISEAIVMSNAFCSIFHPGQAGETLRLQMPESWKFLLAETPPSLSLF